MLVGRTKIFCDLAEKTRADFSEEAIHDFRVSTRRLLIVETLLGPNSKTGKWRKNSRRLLKQLNRLRDLQVLQIRFHEEATLGEQLSRDIGREIGLLRDLNQDIRLGILETRIGRSINLHRKELQAYPEFLARSTCRVWKEIRAEIDRLLSGSDQHDYRLLHALRIQFKSLRYLAEILLDSGIIRGVTVDDFKLWQDFLGNIQDLTVAISWLEEQDQTSIIRQHLFQEIEQQRIAFWGEKENLIKLLNQLDQCIVDSALSCPHNI